jgi:hypothetical protein
MNLWKFVLDKKNESLTPQKKFFKEKRRASRIGTAKLNKQRKNTT